MAKAYRLTSAVVAQIHSLKLAFPYATHRAIAAMIEPPLAHHTVGEVLRGKRGVTVGDDGKPLIRRGARGRYEPRKVQA